MIHPLSVYSRLSQIISPSGLLGVHASQIYVPSTNTNFSSDPSNALSLGIAINIKDLSALTLWLAKSIFLEM
jgi:hypothetical protein